MAPNSYIEIYEPDVLAAEMQPLLSYGTSLFKQSLRLSPLFIRRREESPDGLNAAEVE